MAKNMSTGRHRRSERDEPLFSPEVTDARSAGRRGRLAAVRTWERKRELERLRQLELGAHFAQANAAADAEVQRLRGLRAAVLADRRLDELLRLRAAGVSLGEALAEVDRRFPPSPPEAENDNGWASPRPPGAPGGPTTASPIPQPPSPGTTRDMFDR